jgi:integrase
VPIVSAAALRELSQASKPWKWPLRLTDYDRTAALSRCERRGLTVELEAAVARTYSVRAALDEVHGIERLCRPVEDTLEVIDSSGRYDDRAELMILRWCARTNTAFWSWDASMWRRMLGTTQQGFYAAHIPTPRAGGERHLLVAVAYLLRCFSDVPSLGEVHRVRVAEKIFGQQRVTAALQRVTDVATGWGYRHSTALECAVAELFLINQHPELEALSMELIESAKTRRPDCAYRSSLYCQLCRVLESLGILSGPVGLDRVSEPALRDARIGGIPPAWTAMAERWEATSTLTPRVRNHTRDAILKAGRWLQETHPEITTPEAWTRELSAEYVAAVSRMKVGDYVARESGIARSLGKPLSPRSKDAYLNAMRRFFADAQEWDWITRRFNPFRAFATPRSLKALIGPAPRTITDDIWSKLLWAGLNLTNEDLAVPFKRPDGAQGLKHRNGAYYPLELMKALSLVWLFAGLRSDEIVRLRVGCAHKAPVVPPASHSEGCWMLDVPVHKTGTALTKPVDAIVGEAIASWEKVRPHQPRAIDTKTGESAEFLFSYRARALPRVYLNEGLIPILCRKAGIPPSDARGRISSHRARSTIASQLFNAKEPMTLFELQAWLGHRSPVTTQHYVAFNPTRLARAYTEAQYFQRNLRMMEVLINPQSIKSGATGEPWRYYDLGHGFCSYEFFDQCPHRMACAWCNFYIPRQSAQADLIRSKSSMVRMLQEIPLTDDERAAVDGDVAAIDRLLARLKSTPTPDQFGPTDRTVASQNTEPEASHAGQSRAERTSRRAKRGETASRGRQH